MLNKTQIKNNINWLLTNGSIPVKYLTHKNLIRNNSNTVLLKKLFTEVKKCDISEEIFSKQKPDGSWCSSGSWSLPPSYMPKKHGYTPVSPKYVTTSWILPILGDMGFSVKDERVRKACEYILSFQHPKNGFIFENHSEKNKYNINSDQFPNEPCRFSLILIGLGKVGAESDARVKKAYNLLLKFQQNDGGWVSNGHSIQKNWTRSCPFPSYHAAMALYCTNNLEYKKALIKALNFLIWHLSLKTDNEIQRFFYHGHSIVHELLMFSEYNIGLKEKAVQTILKWLMTMYQPDDSYFKYTGKPISKYSRRKDYMTSRVAKYRLFHLTEDDWLTYYITRIMQNILM